MAPYPIEKKLVVGVSAQSLFNLEEENNIFNEKGAKYYREYQIDKKDIILNKGLAFPFVEKFLNINNVYEKQQPVEVVILSKDDPETAIRIMNSINEYGIKITRGAFTSGSAPYKYIPAYNISLYLSTNGKDVKEAISDGLPAGHFVNPHAIQNFVSDSAELTVAFDFDGVIVDDESEKFYQKQGLEKYREYETKYAHIPLRPGPLADFFMKLGEFQKLEAWKQEKYPSSPKTVRIAIVTARNAPVHLRAINTLRSWNVAVDDLFLLGGIEKKRVLEILKPHLFMDDQITHLDHNMDIPLVHVPFHTQDT